MTGGSFLGGGGCENQFIFYFFLRFEFGSWGCANCHERAHQSQSQTANPNESGPTGLKSDSNRPCCSTHTETIIRQPGQVFSHRVVGAGDEGGRVRARRVRLGSHGEHPGSHAPQQLEHKRTQQERLTGKRRKWRHRIQHFFRPTVGKGTKEHGHLILTKFKWKMLAFSAHGYPRPIITHNHRGRMHDKACAY